MLDLFIAELRRYRIAALLFAAASFVIDFLVFRTSNFLDAEYAVQGAGLAVFVLASMALAVFQFGSYKQPARWLWLLHRPLPRLQIFLALHLASVVLIILAAGIPMELALLATKAGNAAVVDTRHYLGAMHVVLFCILGWQAGSYAMLARHRGAFIVLILPLMLSSLYLASAYVLLLPALLCLLLMGGALFTVFRPERCSSARQPFSVAFAAIPMMLCLYVIMNWGFMIVFNVAFTAAGMMNPANHVPGGFLGALTASGERRLIAGELAKSDDPRAQAWRDQVKPDNERRFTPEMRRFPLRDQAGNADYSMLNAGNDYWVFSHDRMHYVALNEKLNSSKESILGPRGVGDVTPFSRAAVSVSRSKTEAYIFTPQSLILLDRKTLVAQQLVTFAGDEMIASLPEVEGDSLSLITNRRFVEYAWPAVGGMLQERFSIPLAGPLTDLALVQSAIVADGHLVTFIFGQNQEYGATNSQIITVHVQGDKITTIHQRTVVPDAGFLYTQREFWMSPAVFALLQMPRVMFDSGKVLDAGFTTDSMKLMLPRPLSARILALIVLLASAAAAGLWLRRENASPRYKVAWIAACLIIGLPALFALVALHGRQSAKRTASTVGALQPA